uniref:MARVEL domain-containing protein n=1 Tax=Timspurckia oligopyrenoides TaxID=708627 RepID=A0A7S1EQG7_9RHOD|mmetsp:Transcript_12841/g.23094  ORF Transcript_12841/g.23094 Transcript_12841/m.23094 type:complete len:148 (+) Transcript_12841:738-1181(+)
MATKALWALKIFVSGVVTASSATAMGHTIDICSRTSLQSCAGIQGWIISAGVVSLVWFGVMSFLMAVTGKFYPLTQSIEWLGNTFFVAWWAAAVATVTTITYTFPEITLAFTWISFFFSLLASALCLVDEEAAEEALAPAKRSEFSD